MQRVGGIEGVSNETGRESGVSVRCCAGVVDSPHCHHRVSQQHAAGHISTAALKRNGGTSQRPVAAVVGRPQSTDTDRRGQCG